MQKIIIIGSGFSSMAAAAFLAQAGMDVTVLEKNSMEGGRAQIYKADGFTFDMGPSWYWMPDVFERFFKQFNFSTKDFYELIRLNPSYTVVWNKNEEWKIPATTNALVDLLEQKENGAGKKLQQFLTQAAIKYQVGMNDLVMKPGLSATEFFNKEFAKGIFQLDVFSSMKNHIAKYFKDEKIKQLLEFPVLFLGAEAADTPALFSLMNYADIELGTWYPMGGMHEIAKAMRKVAEQNGAKFIFNQEVIGFDFVQNEIRKVKTQSAEYTADTVVSGADYYFTEKLLPLEFQNYSEDYWQSRKLAPSCLLYYVGLNKKLPDAVTHHTLFFDADFELHSKEIYQQPQMPTNPLFYMCCPSKTDVSVAPENCENLFLLIPIATDLKDDDEATREKYFQIMVKRIKERYGMDIAENIVHKRSFSVRDFKSEYNSFKGNAYGLANTLLQTAILKPKIKSKKVKNLYFTGQLTVPGPGVPPALVSGEVVAKYILKQQQKHFSQNN
jgi:phytoene desaturase